LRVLRRLQDEAISPWAEIAYRRNWYRPLWEEPPGFARTTFVGFV